MIHFNLRSDACILPGSDQRIPAPSKALLPPGWRSCSPSILSNPPPSAVSRIAGHVSHPSDRNTSITEHARLHQSLHVANTQGTTQIHNQHFLWLVILTPSGKPLQFRIRLFDKKKGRVSERPAITTSHLYSNQIIWQDKGKNSDKAAILREVRRRLGRARVTVVLRAGNIFSKFEHGPALL
jgi:hypothetical protein